MVEPSLSLATLRFARAGHAAVWIAELDRLGPFERQLTRVLSADEQQRAGRYLRSRDRSRFILRRGVLRSILGHLVDSDPAALVFEYSPQGKPSLAKPLPDLQFSASQSAGLAMVAVTAKRRVGVDIEAIRAVPEAEHIAARFFTTSERESISALPERAQSQAFFGVWTRKEAFTKAVGLGLADSLREVQVWQPLEGLERVVKTELGADPASIWLVTEFAVQPGWAAALAVEQVGCEPMT